MENIQEMDRLFNPASLAMVGASREAHKSGTLFLKSLLSCGFKGKLYPVNPTETEVLGLKCYPSVLDIPDEIDLAILAVPARIIPKVMAECSQKRVKFAVVHSAGFSELGPEGKALENEMLAVARQGGVRVIGPNCMGLYSPGAAINTITFRNTSMNEVGPVAFAGQSGWVTENVIEMGYERGLRFSKVVSIGNQSDLTIEDMMEYFACDPQTRVMAFYVEGIKRGREFLEKARQASKKKPVIVWKAGRSEIGARAAASHTGSLAGSGTVIDAALVQGGVIPARNLDEVIDLAAGFACPVLPQGKRVGLLVEAGGGAVAGSDAAETYGLELPVLSPESQRMLVETLKGIIPPFAGPKNPVDLVWAPAESSTRLFMECSRIMLREVDAVVMVSYSIFDEHFAQEAVRLRDETKKPILVVPGHATERREGMALLTRYGIPALTLPERAMKVLAAMVGYSEHRKQD